MISAENRREDTGMCVMLFHYVIFRFHGSRKFFTICNLDRQSFFQFICPMWNIFRRDL